MRGGLTYSLIRRFHDEVTVNPPPEGMTPLGITRINRKTILKWILQKQWVVSVRKDLRKQDNQL
jgi:hypothetical protein